MPIQDRPSKDRLIELSDPRRSVSHIISTISEFIRTEIVHYSLPLPQPTFQLKKALAPPQAEQRQQQQRGRMSASDGWMAASLDRLLPPKVKEKPGMLTKIEEALRVLMLFHVAAESSDPQNLKPSTALM